MKIKLFLVSLLCAAFSICGASYNGYKIYAVSPTSIEQLDTLNALEIKLNLDFWEKLNRIELDRTYRVLVQPQNLNKFESEMTQSQIMYTIITADVNQMIVNERMNNLRAKNLGRNTADLDFNHFWEIDEIETYLDKIADKYPEIVKLEVLGETYEGNNIIAVKISKAGDVDDTRPIMMVECTIHAREWIATMVCMHLISELVENSEANDNILDGLDWIIVPVLNVDGYKFSHATGGDRFWRKNRSPITVPGKENCFGVDLNRNFRYKWEVKASTSSDPCELTWPGEEAESEIETKIMSNLMLHYKNTVLFLDVHSYGNYLLYPWSYDYILTDNFLEHNEVGARTRQAIYNVNKTVYSMGNSAFTLYRCSGVSTDFAIGEAKIPLAWTIELPRGGTKGFDIEPEKIKTVIAETFPGLRELALFVQERYV